jgi:hypothetical protein
MNRSLFCLFHSGCMKLLYQSQKSAIFVSSSRKRKKIHLVCWALQITRLFLTIFTLASIFSIEVCRWHLSLFVRGSLKKRTKITHFFLLSLYKAVSKLIDQTDKWLNSRDIYKHFTLDTSQRNHVVIVPCTFKPGQESPFRLRVYADDTVTIRQK